MSSKLPIANPKQSGGGGPARERWGGTEGPSSLGAAQAAHPQFSRCGGAARRDPAQPGWGPDGSAGGAGAQPPCDDLAGELEGKSPAEILAAAAARHPGRIALACSFGAEDCLLVDAIARAGLRVEIFTLDTGFLFPETHALWRELEARYQITIRAERPLPPDPSPRPESSLERGGRSIPPWEADPDACCEARKVVPLRAALSRLSAWVTGIRRDQTPERAGARVVEWDGRFGLEKVNPLAAWTHDQVWSELRRLGVPVNLLHGRGYTSIGCAPCTTPVRPGEDPRAGRWRGRAKTECGLHLRPPSAPPPSPPGGTEAGNS